MMSNSSAITFQTNCFHLFSKLKFNYNIMKSNRIKYYTWFWSPTCLQIQSTNSKKLQLYKIYQMPTRTFFTPLDSKFHQFKKIIDNLFSKALVNSSRQKQWGANCYCTLDKINYLDFFKVLDMPDTFFSWFKITELHVWMILFRLSKEDDNVGYFRNGLIEAMWLDLEKRAYKVHSLNKNYKKSMREMYERFKTSLFVYDEGFLSNDMVFATALWYHFFEKDCKDPKLLEVLICFIRYQVDYLAKIPFDTLRQRDLNVNIWTPILPHFEKIK